MNVFRKIGLMVCVLSAVIVLGSFLSKGKIRATTTDGVKIIKSQVTSKAKFYPYKVGKTYMEVMAVKASDGTIRTALNTCQVCYDSGRGFYTQQGDELVCNNCGNRFKVDQIEKVRFGCNPIPVMKGDKTDDGKVITISKTFLEKNTFYFSRWKKVISFGG